MIRKLNLILSERTGPKVKSFIFSHGFVRLFCGMVIGCLLMVCYGVYDYVSIKRAYPDAVVLEDEIAGLKSEIYTRERQITIFQNKIDQLQLKLIRLNHLDHKIRSDAGADDPDPSWYLMTGIGGPYTQTPPSFDTNVDDYQILIDNLMERMEQLDQAVMKRSEEFLLLWGAIREIKQVRESTPSIWPVQGGSLSSGFGYRRSPFTGKREFHSGVDISHRTGESVYATADGTIIQCGYQGALGKTILIDHGFGIVSRYAHLSAIAVTVDKQVRQGEVIGKVGSTGRSTGPHLHYEVRVNDIPVDAAKFMPEYLAKNNPS
jgi:murein DD-endopeptidase MepM/ murein hydrolase activator NlpD